MSKDIVRPRTAPLASLSDLTRAAHPVNKGTPRGTAMLKTSLAELGAGRSVVVDAHGSVIAGNKVVDQAAALNFPIRVVESDGRTLVVVQRVDLTASDPRARQLAVADNRTGEVGLLWDEEALRALQQEGVDLSHWWTESEWARLVGPDPCATGAHEDAVPSPTETTLRVGDLVTLGPHRLLCGDATNCDHVARLLNGLVPSLMVTDPPYGVEYDPAWRVAVDGSPGHALGRVPNDDRADWGDAFALFPGDVAYVWHAGLHAGTVAESLQRHQFELRAQIIWNKGHFVLSRGHYHWQHEPCWYAVRAGATATWQGDRTQTTVWDVPNLNPFGAAPAELDARTGHSAQKPVRLFERPLLNHTRPGDAVYDPFGGSGSALIAATKTARRCCMLELDPGYTQRIVDRWIAFTGRRADVDVERP